MANESHSGISEQSPWSEYRRLVVAELERLERTIVQLRAEAERMRTELALLSDRSAEGGRDRQRMRDRLDDMSLKIHNASQIPAQVHQRIDELEKEYRSARDRLRGIALTFGAALTGLTVITTIWGTWVN